MSSTAISRELGCSVASIQSIVHELGLMPSHHGPQPKSRFKKPDDPTLCSYLAAMIDGEGSIRLDPGKGRLLGYSTSFYVTNTHRGLMDWLEETFGGKVYSYQPLNPKYRTKYVWLLRDAGSVEAALEAVLPWLIVKRDKALKVLKHSKKVSAERQRRALKRKKQGVPN